MSDFDPDDFDEDDYDAESLIDFEVEYTSTWGGDNSDGVMYWYQVEGRCGPRSCDTNPISDSSTKCQTSNSRIVRTVMARNLTELCEKLTTQNPTFKINRVLRFSTPVFSSEFDRVTDLDPTCNTLEDITEEMISSPCAYLILGFDGLIADAEMDITLEPVAFNPGSQLNLQIGGSFTPTVTRNDSNYYRMPFRGGISLGGSSSLSLTLDSFIIDASMGGTLSGDISPTPSYKNAMNGGMTIGGGFYITSVNEDLDIDVLAEMGIFSLKANYSIIDANPLTNSNSVFVSTECCETSNTPLVLELTHNLDKANVLSQFLTRNGYQLNNPIRITYNNTSRLWQGNQYLIGRNTTSNNDYYAWNLVYEFGCINESSVLIGSLENQNVWKLSINVSSRSKSNTADAYSKIVLFFAKEIVCKNSIPVSFDSTFNTITKTVNPSSSLLPVLYDEIGLFKSKYWATNPEVYISVFKVPPPSSNIVQYPELNLPISNVRGQAVLN